MSTEYSTIDSTLLAKIEINQVSNGYLVTAVGFGWYGKRTTMVFKTWEEVLQHLKANDPETRNKEKRNYTRITDRGRFSSTSDCGEEK